MRGSRLLLRSGAHWLGGSRQRAGGGEMAGPIEFLNRTAELEQLRSALKGNDTPALIIVRAPSGYGKSSLTDRLAASDCERRMAIVEPQLQGRTGGRIHEGYFLQRAAAAVSKLNGVRPSFREFLKKRRWHTARNKKVLETFRTLPGPKSGYATAVDYVERLLAFGRYGPDALLSSDQSEAIALCRDFLGEACADTRTALVLRDAQQIDATSLQTLLQLSSEPKGPALLLEYTTGDGRFHPDHQRQLELAFDTREAIYILDLVRLERRYLERVLDQYAPAATNLTGEFYASWDGDLRRLKELRFQLGIGQTIGSARELTAELACFELRLNSRVERLSASARFALACLFAHREQLSLHTLVDIMVATGPAMGRSEAERTLDQLSEADGLIAIAADFVALADDDVVAAARAAPGQAALIALAERALRDHYIRCFSEQDFRDSSAAVALRQAIRLCGRTEDSVQLLRLLDDFEAVIRTTSDPGRYLDVMMSTLVNAELLASERRRLQAHAANLAYDIVDFQNAVAVLEAIEGRTPYQDALLAQSDIEIGRLDRAASYAERAVTSTDSEERLHARLIEAGIALVRNQWDASRAIARSAIDEFGRTDSPLLGHAYRLIESTQDYPECIETALLGVEAYAAVKTPVPLAYAELAAGRHLARMGDFGEAWRLTQSGSDKLEGQVRDAHLVWNARGAINLLDRDGDPAKSIEWLRRALPTARDDFSELVVRCNLAIALWKADRMPAALAEVGASTRILDAPQFSDRHVFWPVCYNLAQVLKAAGDAEGAARMLARPSQTGRIDELNPRQWAYRYGISTVADPATPYLNDLDYYPLFLSHWQADRAALHRLNGAPLR